MPKKCRSCGKDNREEAAFCSECGVPLAGTGKAKKISGAERRSREKTRKFWIKIAAAALSLILVVSVVMNHFRNTARAGVVQEYSQKYKERDREVFSGISRDEFRVEGLVWGMNTGMIKSVYPFAEDSKDPDFTASLMVPRQAFKKNIPHANFMSLAIYMGVLYGIKFEFAASEEYTRQQVKIPDSDERLFGRFLGLYDIFKELYGEPSYTKYEVESEAPLDRIKYVKSGTLKSGARSNIYIYWTLGDTRAELVSFGNGLRIFVTVRFLNMPIYNIASAGK